jgi:hypothetical protein
VKPRQAPSETKLVCARDADTCAGCSLIGIDFLLLRTVGD